MTATRELRPRRPEPPGTTAFDVGTSHPARLLQRRLAGGCLHSTGAALRALRRSRDGRRSPVVPAGTVLWGRGRRCLRRRLPVAGAAIWCARSEPDSAGEGWARGNNGCWQLMDRVEDLGVVDPAPVRGGDP